MNKEKYKSLGNGFKVTFQEGGAKNLFLGWAPTAIGYSAQGICKFGFYEVFKNIYSGFLGEENSYLYRTSLYLVRKLLKEPITCYFNLKFDNVFNRTIYFSFRLLLPQLNSLPTLPSLPWSRARSESRPVLLGHSPPPSGVHSPRSWPRKASTVFTNLWDHSGADKSPTPWWSSHALSAQSRPSTSSLCPSLGLIAPRENSWSSPSLLVILPEVNYWIAFCLHA